MEVLNLKVDTKSQKMEELAERYNDLLNEITNVDRQSNRLRQIVFDVETEIMELERDILRLSKDVESLDNKEEIIKSKLERARRAYECATEDVDMYFKSMKSVVDICVDFMVSQSDKRQQLSSKSNKLQEFEEQRKKHLITLGVNARSIKIDMRKLKDVMVELESELGYSIGSHMIDWCYDREGKITNIPQLSPIAVISCRSEREDEQASLKSF